MELQSELKRRPVSGFSYQGGFGAGIGTTPSSLDAVSSGIHVAGNQEGQKPQGIPSTQQARLSAADLRVCAADLRACALSGGMLPIMRELDELACEMEDSDALKL